MTTKQTTQECNHRINGELAYDVCDEGLTSRDLVARCSECDADVSDMVEEQHQEPDTPELESNDVYFEYEIQPINGVPIVGIMGRNPKPHDYELMGKELQRLRDTFWITHPEVGMSWYDELDDAEKDLLVLQTLNDCTYFRLGWKAYDEIEKHRGQDWVWRATK